VQRRRALSSIGVSWTVLNSRFIANRANEGGGAIFFVSNDRTGTMAIRHSTLERNRNDRFHTRGLAGIYVLGAHSPANRLCLAMSTAGGPSELSRLAPLVLLQVVIVRHQAILEVTGGEAPPRGMVARAFPLR
jgi:hypothetical protein